MTLVGNTMRGALSRRRLSAWALWCHRLAVFCIPFFIVIIVGHRFGMIDTPTVFWLLAIGISLLLAALFAGFIGLYELWTYGSKGGLRSVRGIFLSLVLLAPFVYQSWSAIVLPPLHDISTDLEDPPTFIELLDARKPGMNPLGTIADDAQQQQLATYPKVRSRRYSADADRVFKAILKLVEQRSWKIAAQEAPKVQAAIDIPGSLGENENALDHGIPKRITLPEARPNPADVVVELPDENGEEVDDSENYLEAVARSLIFGFRSDVVIRVIQEDDGSLVDMRSSSRWGPHDLGSNAGRIVSFLKDLDEALLGVAGER